MARPTSRTLDLLGTLVRLGLSAVFFISGGFKVANPAQSYQAVNGYQLFPDGMTSLIASVLPFLELGLAILILIGLGTRIIAILSGLLLIAFIFGVSQAWARGLTIDCGCFGGGGQVAAGQTHYPEEIARDIGFLALAVWLMIRPRTLLSLDGLLLKSAPADQESTESDSLANL